MLTKKADKKDGRKGGATIMLGGAAGAVIGATVGSLAGKALLHVKSQKNMGESVEKVADMTKRMQEKITKK